MSLSVGAPVWAKGARAVLIAARSLYAADPSHAPRGQFTNRCPVRCIDRCADGWHDGEVEQALADAAGLGRYDIRREIIDWNAIATTEEVLAAFDRAIEATV